MHCTQSSALLLATPLMLADAGRRSSSPHARKVSLGTLSRCVSFALTLLTMTTAVFAADEEPAAEEIDFSRLIFEAEPLPTLVETLPALTSTPAAAADGTPAPAGDAPPDSTAIPRYENEIGRLMENSGPYTDQLREQYESLGELYQRDGDHEKAISNFENAMHIDRVSGGLFTLEQIPLVENIIESYTALGDVEEVDNHQEYLYYIQQKTYADDDPRLLAAKEAWADWNVDSFLKTGPRGSAYPDGVAFSSSSMSRPDYVAVQNPSNGNIIFVPRNQMPNILSPTGAMSSMAISDLYMRSSAYSVSPEQIIDERLRRAQDLYEEIKASPNQEYQAAHGTDLDHKLANIAYAVKQQIDELEANVRDNSFSFDRMSAPRSINPMVTRGYTKSRESLEAIAAKLEADTASDPMKTAQAYIDVGDLHLGFDRVQRGIDAYDKALAILATAQKPLTEISALFNPQPLIPVPGFALHPFSREFFGMTADAELDYKGHIDLTLKVEESGDVEDVRIIAATENTTQRLRNALLDYLREHRMRPVVQNGAIVDEYPMTLRIHYFY